MVAISLILIMVIQGLFAHRGSKDIIGTWKTEKGTVTIVEEGDRFTGTSTLETGEEVMILKNLKFEEDQWVGEIYAVKRKKYYPVKCMLLKGGKLEVKISAGIMSKTLEWINLKSINN